MKWLIGIGTLVLVGLAILVGVAGTKVLNGDTQPRTASSQMSPANEGQRFGDQVQVPKEDPAPTDFALRVTVIGKQCFGGPDCVYTYNVDPWIMSAYPPPGRLLTIVYTVTGANQDLIGHFTINESGGIVANSGRNVVALGPENTTFRATATSVDES